MNTILDSLHSNILKTLTVDQIDAVINLILYGGVYEVPLDTEHLGRFGNLDRYQIQEDAETETIYSLVAAIIELTGKNPQEIPTLATR